MTALEGVSGVLVAATWPTLGFLWLKMEVTAIGV
jgi:hypothetical protein